MSQKSNTPYFNKVYDDGATIEYEGYVLAKNYTENPKRYNQP
jgi:hypothetical protein